MPLMVSQAPVVASLAEAWIETAVNAYGVIIGAGRLPRGGVD